jgi:hypothetical protein
MIRAKRPIWAVPAKVAERRPTANYIKLRVFRDDITGKPLHVGCESYEKPIWTGGKSNGGRHLDGEGVTDQEFADKNRSDTLRRARQKVVEYARCNFTRQYSKWITLTYADNQQDLRKGQQDLLKFHRAISRQIGKNRFLWAVERQQRGAVHYHMMLDYTPIIPMDLLKKCWPHGRVNIKAIYQVDDLGRYMGKYLSKDMDITDRGTCHVWGSSQGMKTADTFYGEECDKIWQALNIKKGPDYHSEWQSEHLGKVVSTEYNLQRV